MGKPVFVAPPKWQPPPPGQPLALRPLNLGEKLDIAFRLWTRNFWTLLLPVLLFTTPLSILSTFVVASINEDAFSFDTETEPDIGTQLAGQGAQMVLMILAGLLATAAVTRAVSDAYTGHKPSTSSTMAVAIRRLPSLLWVLAIQVFVVLALAALPVACFAIGGLPLIIAGAVLSVAALAVLSWLYVPWMLVNVALLTEDVRGTAALRRTFRLVKGRWWSTAGMEAVLALIVFVIGMPIGIVFGLGAGILAFANGDSEVMIAVITTLGTILQNALMLPLFAAGLVVLYVDLRVRKEGFDLELMTRRMGA
jgi:hypothetical protein